MEARRLTRCGALIVVVVLGACRAVPAATVETGAATSSASPTSSPAPTVSEEPTMPAPSPSTVLNEIPTIPGEPTGPPIDGDPVSAEDADAAFRLTLEADGHRYRAGQPIEVMATLAYLGPADSIVARGSSNPRLIGFAVESDDPAVGISPAFTTDCGAHEVRRDEPLELPFAKSGGYSPDEPLAPFYDAYFGSQELRLPAGTWTITAAGSWYTGRDCGDRLHSLSASVTVVVEP